MATLLDSRDKKIRGSKTVVSFETTGGDSWKEWDRFIAIEGKHAYHIGNVCGTCEFFFERLENPFKPVEIRETIEGLNTGLTSIDQETLDSVSKIIPNGKYKVLLLEILPRLIKLTSSDDYFATDQKDLWEDAGSFGLPHYPKIQYYRGTDQEIGREGKIFEFINPLVPPNRLKQDRIEFYKLKFEAGLKPTAIALAVLDVKQPAEWPDDLDPKITEHWCFAHYLLDGHHKVFAASETNKPITILTFLSIDKGVSTKENIKELIETIKNTVPNKG